MTRYVIVGAGAIGVSLAVELGDRGHDVLLVARGATLDYLAAQPLSYHSHAGHRAIRLPAVALDADLGLRTGDIVVLAVKSQDLATVAPAIAWREVTGDHGQVQGIAANLVPVVTTQNGLDAERTAARWFDTVLGAVFLISAQHVRTGEVRVGGHPHVGGAIAGIASALAPESAEQALKTFTTDLHDANFLTKSVTDIRSYKAAKIVHSVRNGIEVLAGDRKTKDAVGQALSAEARTVLAAAGFDPPDTSALILDPAQGHFSARSGVTTGRQSTWQSFARGTPTNEVDYLNGEIALLARLHGIPAPLNTRLQQLLGRATHTGGGLDLPGIDTLTERLAAGQD
ncbi:2-dehydropantoate 2-reductase N-terminal domain-containing protein [Nocardia sp. NPDC052001]|uniref:ketopantoate reductase family protein n=1 Tax=Nocardia sp. NPDC052001 TaxID=3154853 RepID=UPI00342048DE